MSGIIIAILTLTVAADSPYPSTCVVPAFAQAKREFLKASTLPETRPTVEASDAWGHRYKIETDGVVVEQVNGGRYVLNGSTGLPIETITCAATAPNGDVWFGSRQGAIRWTSGRFEYYAGNRWLPDDRVQAVQCLPDNSVYVWTPAGVGHIYFRRMTLEQKAEHYEKLTDARHKRFGYVSGCDLTRPGDLSQWQNASDDNDGLWTAMYVAAESFRYAVTQSPQARQNARQSLLALLELEKVTGIPGFPARSRVHKSEAEFGKPRGGEWHKTPDGEWEWKGDTSSDEIVGHYFGWQVYYDLVADDDEKAMIRKTVRRVTDHIIDNGYCLIDVDGEPTRWAVWAPERLNDDPECRGDRGLNSLEILSHLKVASHITGDEKYDQAAMKLIQKHHYALNTINQKVLPDDFPGAIENHPDNQLAFLAYYSLLKLENTSALRAFYLASIERSWRIQRSQRSPLYNFIYGAVTNRACDVESAVKTLEEIPLDLVRWTVTNSLRKDLKWSALPDRFDRPQLVSPLPYQEQPLQKWSGNPYLTDGGREGLAEECGTYWLLPYWMGRYHRIIDEAGQLHDQPTTTQK